MGRETCCQKVTRHLGVMILDMVADQVRDPALAVAATLAVFIGTTVLVLIESDDVAVFMVVLVMMLIPTYLGNSVIHSPRWLAFTPPSCVLTLAVMLNTDKGAIVQHPLSATFSIGSVVITLALAMRTLWRYRKALGCGAAARAVLARDLKRRRPSQRRYVQRLLRGVRRVKADLAAKRRAAGLPPTPVDVTAPSRAVANAPTAAGEHANSVATIPVSVVGPPGARSGSGAGAGAGSPVSAVEVHPEQDRAAARVVQPPSARDLVAEAGGMPPPPRRPLLSRLWHWLRVKLVGTDRECVFYPTRFLIAQSGSFIVMLIFSVFVFLTRKRVQQDLLAYVHDFKRLLQQYAAAVTLLDEQKREIHDIDQALDPYASSADPNVRALVSKVDELNTELQKVNVNQTLQFDYDAVTAHIDNLSQVLPACMTIAVVVTALSLTVATLVGFPLFRKHVREMRRGEYAHIIRSRTLAPLSAAGDFVGMQVSAAILSFILGTSGITLILTGLAWSVTRNLLLKLATILIPVAILAIVRIAYKHLVVNKLLSDGETVRHRRVFACHEWISVFYVTVEGLLLSAGRMTYTMIFTLANFPRLDLPLLPAHLVQWDYGYVTYLAMLKTYEMYGNPVGVLFSEAMAQRLAESRREAADAPTHNSPPAGGALTHVKPVAAAAADARMSGARQRARNRWQLAYTLQRNPHLMFERGWYLRRQRDLRAAAAGAGSASALSLHQHEAPVDAEARQATSESHV